MKLIVGLGNPGKEYEDTRHNVGFKVIDKIAENIGKVKFSNKFDASFYNGIDFILLKPQTFMNLSGKSVKQVVDFYKINPSDIFVICDELDIPVGQAKIKISSSSGGHKGIENIINQIGTPEFYRLKIGIGRPKNKSFKISDYVLSKFEPNEDKVIKKVISEAADISLSYIYNDINFVISDFNGRNKRNENSSN